MQRENSFRGKRVGTMEWVYGYLFGIWERRYILWGTTNDVPNMIEVIPDTVGRDTGVKDKNGKEIHEDDRCIVSRPCVLATGQIKYIDGCPVFSEDKTGTLLTMLDLRLNGYEIKVVGNIHDDKTSLSQPSIDTE